MNALDNWMNECSAQIEIAKFASNRLIDVFAFCALEKRIERRTSHTHTHTHAVHTYTCARYKVTTIPVEKSKISLGHRC